nr:phosphotransferase [Ramlibacter cellulosilyticus]
MPARAGRRRGGALAAARRHAAADALRAPRRRTARGGRRRRGDHGSRPRAAACGGRQLRRPREPLCARTRSPAAAPLAHAVGRADDDRCLAHRIRHVAQRLADRVGAMPGLSRVHCHGDCHGSNNFMRDGPGGRVASFFDFDEAGPGYLAYELSVYLWAMLPRKPGGTLDADALERWRRYLAGYRAARAVPEADLEAIPPFIAVRQFWLMGEYAGRASVWGTESIPTSWLRKQVDLLQSWETMAVPA